MTPLRFVSLAVWTLSAVHSVTSIPRLAGFSPRLALALNSRQSGLPAVPPQCVSTCEPVNTILETNSCPPAECCTKSFQSEYFGCLKCVGLAANVTNAEWAQAQTLVDALTVACSIEGFTLPELTLPGQNPNRTLSTVSGSHTSKASAISQITLTALPSSLAPSTIISQKTVTEVPTPTSPRLPGRRPSRPHQYKCSNTSLSRIGHRGGLSGRNSVRIDHDLTFYCNEDVVLSARILYS
ncbi:hypothetical protein B0H13DRAFT_2181578 [Mycena leptocephala]|nr:hypothetical protein B0H13DRAFT_2181578 [Mycena leptocephala]